MIAQKFWKRTGPNPFLLIPIPLLLLAPPETRADAIQDPLNMSLDALINLQVETVSRHEEPADKAPGTVHVFTQEMIRRRGYTSLADLLRHVPGFAVFHGDLQHTAVVRGLAANDNEKFTLLINGIEINQVNEPNLLDGPINLENVERVEVIVGPSSLFEPANTLVATINLITKEIDGTEIIASTGTERKAALTLTAGKTHAPNRKTMISVSVEERTGWDAWDRTRSGSPDNLSAGRKTTRKSTDLDHLIVATSQVDQWTFQLLSRRRSFPELRLYNPTNTIPTLAPEYVDQMHGASIRYETSPSDTATLFAEGSAFYKKSERSADTFAWLSLAQVDYGAELGYILNLDYHLIQTGIQGLFEDNLDNFFDGDGNSRRTFYDEDTFGIGLYLADTYSPTEKIRLFGGLRADYNTLLDDSAYWSGRLGGSYAATENWSTKLFINRSVRMPSPLGALNEIWGLGTPDDPFLNGNLSPTVQEPEILSTIEWANTLHHRHGRVVTTIYYQLLRDFISWGAPYTNVGDYRGWGIELSAEQWITRNLMLWANASHINSTFDPDEQFGGFVGTEDGHEVMDDQDRLLGAPIYTANTGLDWDLTDRVLFSPALRYFARQPIKKTNGSFDEIDHRCYLDATLLLKDLFLPGWDLRLSAKNLLDNRQFVGGAWQEGEYRPRGASFELSTRILF